MTRNRNASCRSPSITARDVLGGLVVFHLVAPTLVFAYLDPITGSIVLQVLAAGFLAAAATFRKSRDWISGVVRRITRGCGR